MFSQLKYKYRKNARKCLRGSVAMLVFTTLVFRMAAVNFPSFCSFIQLAPLTDLSVTFHSDQPEYSSYKMLTEISPAMVKDSSESNEDTFSKSSKYPLLLVIFTALAKIFSERTTAQLVAKVTFREQSLRKHLAFSILQI